MRACGSAQADCRPNLSERQGVSRETVGHLASHSLVQDHESTAQRFEKGQGRLPRERRGNRLGRVGSTAPTKQKQLTSRTDEGLKAHQHSAFNANGADRQQIVRLVQVGSGQQLLEACGHNLGSLRAPVFAELPAGTRTFASSTPPSATGCLEVPAPSESPVIRRRCQRPWCEPWPARPAWRLQAVQSTADRAFLALGRPGRDR